MKKIRIFNYPWHLAHQYELMKIPDTEWTWLSQHRRQYSLMPRGDFVKKFNVKYVPYYEKGKYDVALLHLDQQCLEDSLWAIGKGSVYREINSVIKDIPKIVIMHGTPFYPEKFDCDITKENYIQKGFNKHQIGMSSQLIIEVKKIVGSNLVITNSKTAAKQWGIGTPIIHGLDKEEWLDLPKEPRVVTMISAGGLDKYYDRTFLETVKEELRERDIQLCHITVDAFFRNWEEYKNFLGRSLVYFNPTKESPMPRSRTEAMLSGCCVVTTPHQDASDFIEDGKNGFIVKRNPSMVADLIQKLIFDYKNTLKVGQEGKKTALELFDGDRFRQDWRKLLEKVTKK